MQNPAMDAYVRLLSHPEIFELLASRVLYAESIHVAHVSHLREKPSFATIDEYRVEDREQLVIQRNAFDLVAA